MKAAIFLCFFAIIFSCTNDKPKMDNETSLRFEKINYYKYPKQANQKPFKYRLTYYFNDNRPHRWLELDSLKQIETEYIYQYNTANLHIGAKYREEGEEDYSIEIVSFINETIQVTEWLDSNGEVYYTMTDYLNENGKTIRAEFKGDKIHGYDSTFYTSQGFPKRIFFTNIKGKIFNDRTFIYDSINPFGDWIARKKIMSDTIREIQIREVYYNNHFTTEDSIYYPNLISTRKKSQNVFSFTADKKSLFLTETEDWDIQKGKLYTYANGLYTLSKTPTFLDTLYNGAISPSGNRIIFTKKNDNIETNWLIENNGTDWSKPINITQNSNISGGYFHWHNETDLFFYTKHGNGDIVQGKINNNQLEITDKLKNLNSNLATEFSPYVDKQKSYIIFTRYLKGEESQQGFFISYNSGSYDQPIWEKPEKIKALSYGWNARIINNNNQFLYTDGDNIKSVPAEKLNIKL